MAQNNENIVTNRLKTRHIIFPILCGLAGIAWMIVSEFQTFSEVWLWDYFDAYSLIFIFCAVLMLLVKDGSGMWRLWFLSNRRIGFQGLFRVRMLYEFTSAITPTVAGGSTLEMLFINREGIKIGESTTISIVSLFCDELFFVLSFPVMLLILPINELFNASGGIATVLSLFLIAYAAKFVWVCILFVGIFIKPEAIAWMIKQLFRLKWIRKWQYGAMRTAADIRTCSSHIKHESIGFWLKTIGLTFIIWIARFLIVNFLIMAFCTEQGDFLNLYDNVIVLCRQIISMVVMMVAPTPGGSGFIEVLFENYLGEFIPGNGGIVMLLITSIWRFLTYYYYLILGVIIAPRWIATKFNKK